MGAIKGAKEFKAWQEGKKLSRKQSMLAHCFQCNGEDEGAEDCLGVKNCVLYPYFHYKGKKRQNTSLEQEKPNLEPENSVSMDYKNANKGIGEV